MEKHPFLQENIYLNIIGRWVCLPASGTLQLEFLCGKHYFFFFFLK